MKHEFKIRIANPNDVPLILSYINELALYEKLSHEVVATEELLHLHLFGEKKHAEVILVDIDDQPAGFALFLNNFSTFLGRPGIYLEDLYIKPQFRGMNAGKKILVYLAILANERGYGRIEWSVLDWNKLAIDFYKKIGAVPMSEWTVFRISGEALNTLAVAE